jgi:threonine dehydratase
VTEAAIRLVRASGERRADLLPTAADLAEAAAHSFGEHGVSPVALARAPRLDRDGARVWLALESLQVTGSFKVRGALFALTRLVARGVRSVVAASAGNHGAGVAYAARILGVAATVVVPKSAPRKKVHAITSTGAKVVEHAGGYDAAEAFAVAMAKERGVPFLSPYDDVDVVTGNGATLAFEVVRALGRSPDVAVVPFGGGGLATGLACGLGERGEGVVFGAQSEASPAFAQSLERGAAVTSLPPVRHTLADGLEGGISERAFARARGVVAGVFIVPEEHIETAMRFAHKELGLVLEGSAAVALAPVLCGAALPAAGDVVLVLTGRNVDPERLGRLVC